jgi:hypothetical protein
LWELFVRDVASGLSGDLDIALVDLRQRHEVKGPRVGPDSNMEEILMHVTAETIRMSPQDVTDKVPDFRSVFGSHVAHSLRPKCIG